MSRVDGFSDVVFGFALTLLVVSLEVPKTYAELHETLRGFFPFAVSFLFLIMLWFAHFRLFRRFGLHDHATIIVNACLLFVVLFFVYPLKFLFTLVLGGANASEVFQSTREVRELMVLYGLGFAATYLLIAGLYYIGWLHRKDLELNEVERILTVSWITDNVGVACVGVLSAFVATVLPANRAGYAGYIFFLIAIFKTVHRTIAGRYIRRARARARLAESTIIAP